MGKGISRLLLLCLVALLALGGGAHAAELAPRAPWAPAPPDACGSLTMPCGQIDDFNLSLRVAGVGFWGAPGQDAAAPPPWVMGGGGSVGATLSLYKSAELGLSLPLAYLRAPGQTWIYGPPEVRVRWRLGPRMGPGPFGRAWPADEEYPKTIPAPYDLQPARWTLALGFRFVPLWPGVSGVGPRVCRASDSSCLAEAGLQASLDLRAWRLLLTAHTEAVAAGDHSHLIAGGRVAADVAGVASLFSEASLQLPLAPEAQRAGLVLVGAGLRGFRGAQFSAWYGRSFGGVSGDHLAGVALDVPIGVLWGALQALSAAVDPFLARDGWIYDDRCAPLFALSHQRAAAAGIKEGAHLWRCGDTLYHDQGCTQLAVAVEPRQGSPAKVQGVATPWPDAAAARRYEAERARWLQRYAEAPDPERRELCEELVAQTVAALQRSARAQRLQTQCAQAQQQKAGAMANAYSGPMEHGPVATMIGAQIWEAIACGKQVSAQTLAGAAMVLRPGGGGITLASRPPQPPAGAATHAPPGAPPAAAPGPAAGAGAATHAPPAAQAAAAAGPRAAPPYAPPGYAPPNPAVATHARPAPAAPGPAAGAPAAPRPPVRTGGAAPVRRGQQGVAQEVAHQQALGNHAQTEVTLDTPAGRRRVDVLVTEPGGGQHAVEVKTGQSRYTPAQQRKDEALAQQGGTPAGDRAAKAGLKGPVHLKTKVVRYP